MNTEQPPQHRILAKDWATQWLGVEVLNLAPGYAKTRMRLREEMLNGFGIAHGGMIFSLADTTFALACNDAAGDGSTVTVAQGVDISFLSPAPAGAALIAEGRELATTGRSGLYDVTVTREGEEGGVVALFRGRCRTIPAR